MKLSVQLSRGSRKKRALLTVIATGSLLALPGCGIPQLRCPKPGAALPQTYYRPEIRNQDSRGFYDDAVIKASASSYDQASGSGNEAANAKSQEGSVTFASFIKTASAIDLDDADNSTNKAANSGSGAGNSAFKATDSSIGAGNSGDVISGMDNLDADFGLDVVPSPINLDANSFENSAQLGWYQFFDDPTLAGLIDLALVGNQELKILAEEIQIASNEVYARSGEYRPFATLGAGVGVEKPGRYTRAGAVEDQLQVADGRGFPDPLPNFLVGTNISWELDIWKRLRNAQGAAAMRYLGTQEGRNYVLTRLVADVAENYYELLALDNRLITLDKTIEIQQSSLKTAEAMKAAARGTELAVQRFQAEVRKNQSEKLIIEQSIVETENRINFLLGRYPQRVERPSVDYIDLNLRALSVGVPPQLLQNRPDIREAERKLQAAGLDIQVARARFYPSLNLSAGLGYNAFNAGYLFSTPASLIYGVGGDLIAPLINKRAIQASYRTANAKQLQAVYDYQRTVLNAYTEVINHMTKVDNYGKSIEIKKQQLESLVGSVDSATKLFQNARGEYLDVLLAQRDMMEARMVLIETKQQQLGAVVNTYQALGGGGF